MSIKKFADFNHSEILLEDFIQSLWQNVNESEDQKSEEDSVYRRIEKKVFSDLKLDTKLVFTFGAGIGALYPVVMQMLENMSIFNFELSKQSAVLLTIAAITIIYLEEKKSKSSEEEERLTKDSRSMLEELRMRGIGDGIVKKVIKALTGIKNIFSKIGKHLGAAIGGIIDMFSYTAILIPIINAVLKIIVKYDMGVDEMISNFFILSTGIVTKIAKHGMVEVLRMLKKLITPSTEKDIIDEIETPVVQKFGDFTHGMLDSETDGEPINEQ